MPTVAAAGPVALQPDQATELWRDPRRWSSFVEGLQRIEEMGADWPEKGAKLVWDSGAGGRGRVTEKVSRSDATAFATLVYEERLAGTQTAEFTPNEAGGADMRLTLEYQLTSQNPFNPVVDLLFIRRALRDALRRTVRRFAVEAEEDSRLHSDSVPGRPASPPSPQE